MRSLVTCDDAIGIDRPNSIVDRHAIDVVGLFVEAGLEVFEQAGRGDETLLAQGAEKSTVAVKSGVHMLLEILLADLLQQLQ